MLLVQMELHVPTCQPLTRNHPLSLPPLPPPVLKAGKVGEQPQKRYTSKVPQDGKISVCLLYPIWSDAQIFSGSGGSIFNLVLCQQDSKYSNNTLNCTTKETVSQYSLCNSLIPLQTTNTVYTTVFWIYGFVVPDWSSRTTHVKHIADIQRGSETVTSVVNLQNHI